MQSVRFFFLAYQVDNQWHIGVLFREYAEQLLKLLVDNDAINVGMLKYVSNVVLLQSIIRGNHDAAASDNTIY